MHVPFSFSVLEQSESSARVFLQFPENVVVRSFTGTLKGPQCNYARTLPADFSFSCINSKNQAEVTGIQCPLYSAQVIDPCYWTAELPFLYDLQVSLVTEDGQQLDQTTQVGLTRWETHWRNLMLDNRRTVVRGASTDATAMDVLSDARVASTALLMDHYDSAFCKAASEAGVILCVDLRTAGDSLPAIVAQLDFSPSVLLAFIGTDQAKQEHLADHWPSHCIVAQLVSKTATSEDYLDSRAVVGLELSAGERPPSWLAMASRPVVVIRRGEDYSDLGEARAACDRLQAELAPEFDLAGYFVAP